MGQEAMFENESFGSILKEGDVVTASLDCENGKFSIVAPEKYKRKYVST